MVAWDDRSKPTVNYGSLASGRGAGWPEKKTPQHVHRYTARPSLFLLRVSCPDLVLSCMRRWSNCDCRGPRGLGVDHRRGEIIMHRLK